MRFVNRFEQFLDTLAAKNLQRLSSSCRLWRVLDAEKERGNSGTMIQVQVANPNRVDIDPIEIFFGQAMRRVGAAIQQQRSVFSFQPERRRGPLRMKYGSPGSENDELHAGKARLKIENCKALSEPRAVASGIRPQPSLA